MKKIALLLTVITTSLLFTGCSIRHPIAKDYGQYLINNEGGSSLPKTKLATDYAVGPTAQNHHYEFRAATVGLANLWIVEFGKLLDETLKSKDVQAAFTKLTPGTGASGSLLTFELEKYEFKNYRAYITLNIKWVNNGEELLSKDYSVEGKAQGGKMFMGGVFAMKNAIHQSTKLGMDEIMTSFINDLNGKLADAQ